MRQAATPTVSVTYSKSYIRKVHLFSEISFWARVCWVTAGLLNKLASWMLWCPLCLCLSPPATFPPCNIQGFRGQCFHFLVTGSASPACLEVGPCQATLEHVVLRGRSPVPLNRWGEFQFHRGTWKGLGPNLGTLLISLVRSLVGIQACLRRQKGSFDKLPTETPE
jgi:hypothetical protein